ncbi:hypothetical protein BH23THE1_BH23THE1_17230 [soil metagenome]
MILQEFIAFFVLVCASSIPWFSNYSTDIWAQTAVEVFQPIPIIGNITEVNNNHTVEVNGNLLVSLAFIDSSTTDQTIHQDGIHFMSVLCPIRSPVIVLPISNFTNLHEDNQSPDLTEIEGIVFCQSSNISDVNYTKSINEQLIDARLATLDSKICNNATFASSYLAKIMKC